MKKFNIYQAETRSSKVSIFILVFYIIAFIGYVMNIYKFVQLDFKPSYKAEIIRGIGVATPLGSIIGFISIDDIKEKEN